MTVRLRTDASWPISPGLAAPTVDQLNDRPLCASLLEPADRNQNLMRRIRLWQELTVPWHLVVPGDRLTASDDDSDRGQRSLTAAARRSPSIEPGILMPVMRIRMPSRASRIAMASSALAAAMTRYPAFSRISPKKALTIVSSSTVRITDILIHSPYPRMVWS